MTILLFVRQADIYNAGETAGFDETKPHELVKLKRLVATGAARVVELDENGKVKEPVAEQADLLPDPQEKLREELADKKKADLVVFAKEQYGLDLSEDSKKDELVAAILEAAAKVQE